MAAAQNLEKEQIFGMAEKEMEYRVDLFNRLTQTCFDKCIEKKYKESELNMGENSCIDRCVSKYWQILPLIAYICQCFACQVGFVHGKIAISRHYGWGQRKERERGYKSGRTVAWFQQASNLVDRLLHGI
ncbi:mitochondrial import inner membrane translocase subunit TIM10 [Carex littledalei]|uniref:Mitochondrial import inner membrane translocase subunit n=1 Tax=Carex littledalei TaxID=544730 RepID=A0A833R5U2_9POAL|nr:mitochondrial import inner membrane translocase subunit TIM10 [Carex littledalei]